MNEEIFKPYKVLSTKLNSLPKKAGQFIVTTDTNEIYLDIDNSTRKLIGTAATANSSKSGLMSSTDKSRLDIINSSYASQQFVNELFGDINSILATLTTP